MEKDVKKSKEEIKKNRRKEQLIVFCVDILVLICAVIFYAFSYETKKYEMQWDKLYEQQREYLMNVPADIDDVFTKDEFCKFVEISVEQVGGIVDVGGESYASNFKVNFKNLSDKNFEDVVVQFSCITQTGENATCSVVLGDIDAGAKEKKDIQFETACIIKKVCLVSERRVKNAVCYTFPRGENVLTIQEATNLVDTDLIKDVIGEKPAEPSFANGLKIVGIVLLVEAVGYVLWVFVFTKRAKRRAIRSGKTENEFQEDIDGIDKEYLEAEESESNKELK